MYGPSLMGDSAFFPTGVLGDALVATDYAPFFADHAPITQKVIADHQLASASINAVSIVHTMLKLSSLTVCFRVVV